MVGGVPIRVASVEDLILMKLISERPKDLADAKRSLRRYGPTLDGPYLDLSLSSLLKPWTALISWLFIELRSAALAADIAGGPD